MALVPSISRLVRPASPKVSFAIVHSGAYPCFSKIAVAAHKASPLLDQISFKDATSFRALRLTLFIFSLSDPPADFASKDKEFFHAETNLRTPQKWGIGFGTKKPGQRRAQKSPDNAGHKKSPDKAGHKKSPTMRAQKKPSNQLGSFFRLCCFVSGAC